MTYGTVILQVGLLLWDKCAEHSEAYFDVGSLKSCRCLRTNWTHFARTARSERNWYIRIPGMTVVFWQLCWFGAPGTQYRPRGFPFSFPSAIVRTILAPKWRHRLLSRGILTARFKYHFWGQNGSTLKACKIVTFNARCLKLWNRVCDKVNYKTTEKQISCHRQFKWSFSCFEIKKYSSQHCIFIDGLAHVKPGWCGSLKRQESSKWCVLINNWRSLREAFLLSIGLPPVLSKVLIVQLKSPPRTRLPLA